MKCLAVVADGIVVLGPPRSRPDQRTRQRRRIRDWIKPTDSEVGSLWGYGGLVRLNPKKGWGVAGGFNWFRADVENPSGEPVTLAKLRVGR